MNNKHKSSVYSPVITAVLIVITVSLFMNGCSKADNKSKNTMTALDENTFYTKMAEQGNIIEIRERMFATQVSEVYMNPNDYLQKTIRLEGLFMSSQPYQDRDPVCYVVRYAPGGCCGDDGMAGFEVKWAKSQTEPNPAGNSWVEATGVLKQYMEGMSKYLYLELSALTVLDKRGAEYVRN